MIIILTIKIFLFGSWDVQQNYKSTVETIAEKRATSPVQEDNGCKIGNIF